MSTRVGIEHEYAVMDGETQIDFRHLIHHLEVPGHQIDPVDPHAYRLESGILLTCDGPEAEVATPPIVVRPGFVSAVRDWTSHAAQTLRSLLPDRFEMRGVSTHLSVSVDDRLAPVAAGYFARTFAPALMLMWDGPDSPGLLVRPRFGRVELGGEYASRCTLEAAVALGTGAVMICRDVAAGHRSKAALPPAVKVDLEPALLRYGWFVDRRAFGIDLYTADRATRLRRELLGKMSVGSILGSAWEAARSPLNGFTTPEDLEAADRMVHGVDPLPVDTGIDASPEVNRDPPGSHPLGSILIQRRRPEFRVEPVVATWDFTVLRIVGRRDLFVTVPAADSGDFIDLLTAGELDSSIAERLSRSTPGSCLDSYRAAMRRGVYDEMPDRSRLTVPERAPDGTLLGG